MAATPIGFGHATGAIGLHLTVVVRRYAIAKTKHLAKTAKCFEIFWVAKLAGRLLNRGAGGTNDS
ncbi:MAG: hypothetical protein ACAF42_16035 [Limnothrix sp. BL-A-16]